ncbi:MAG TPA: type II secretion system protein GspN [Desulfatiglandales bacterium]|nr:type II secretion system protein GspN [Desulfatiglandales bacterium]
MIQFFSKHKWLLYILYIVILTLALLYYRFPSDAVRGYIQATVNRINPNILITYERMSLSFPFRLRFEQAEIHVKKYPEKDFFKTKEVIIRPKIWSIIRGRPEYCLVCEAYDGNISGCIDLQKDDRGDIYSSSFTLNDIRIDDNSPLPPSLKGRLNGVLKGSVTYSGRDIYDPGGTGDASIDLLNGSFRLSKPLLEIEAFDFKEVLIKITLKDKKLNIINAELKGDGILGQASGSISLRDSIQKSRLNIKGTFEPTAALFKDSKNANDTVLLFKKSLKNGKIPFTLQGTVDKPSFRLI